MEIILMPLHVIHIVVICVSKFLNYIYHPITLVEFKLIILRLFSLKSEHISCPLCESFRQHMAAFSNLISGSF